MGTFGIEAGIWTLCLIETIRAVMYWLNGMN